MGVILEADRHIEVGGAMPILADLDEAGKLIAHGEFERLCIAGIPTVRANRADLAALMLRDHVHLKAGKRALPRLVFSSNGAVIARFHSSPSFRTLMMQADVIDADGMPLVIASRLLCRRPLAERTATTDFVHDAATAASRAGLRFFFLGGREGIADQAAANLRLRHPSLEIVGIRHGYFVEGQEDVLCAEIRASGADVLWVGLGSPRQESFAVRNRERLAGLTWVRTCGGLFDHVAERIPRAPRWMQSAGLEWLFRAFQEPLRLGPRYVLTNPLAAYHLLTKTHD